MERWEDLNQFAVLKACAAWLVSWNVSHSMLCQPACPSLFVLLSFSPVPTLFPSHFLLSFVSTERRVVHTLSRVFLPCLM